MDMEKHKNIFNNISTVYNWFFSYQKKTYIAILEKYRNDLKLPEGAKILDIGCGTGAMASALIHCGYDVTGVDMAKKMVNIAMKRGIHCIQGNVIEGLDFEDNSFDLVISVFVAHGLDWEKRKKLFDESARISRGKVLFHDYGDKRNWVTDFIETLEDGDYFNFIKQGLSEMNESFRRVEVKKIRDNINWYICSP